MRETLEVLERLEVSREPRIRRQLEHLNQRVDSLNRERAGFREARLRLQNSRDSLMLVYQGGQSVSVLELRCAFAHELLLEHQINEVLKDEQNREQQVSLARTRAQHVADRLAKCLRRQAKLEGAIKRIGKQVTSLQDRQEQAHTDELSSIQWQRQFGQ